jgi:hypothetical protein
VTGDTSPLLCSLWQQPGLPADLLFCCPLHTACSSPACLLACLLISIPCPPQPFKLTRAELVQVLNLAPASEVEVHLIVEECEDRLNEQQMDAFLQVVAKHLPRHNSQQQDT